MNIVRTRMAPSPTGEMHVGSMATLLKNYAFAKKHQGKFILRIEDTDQEREVPGAVVRILQIIKDYGLDWDEGPDIGGDFGPYTQSQRLHLYQEQVQKLVEQGKAYYCFCSKERLENSREEQRKNHLPPKYDRHCLHLSTEEVQTKLANHEPYVIRLKVPDNQPIIFHDLLRGEIKIDSSIIDDQVLLKSDGFPTYHLAVVVDDHLMQITHILRGEEWISSTPKHVLLYQAFGWEPPVFAHIPVFLNPDGKGKMSKRKGTVSAQSFLDRGYLPEAMLNFFMILGWTPKDQREILSLDEYIKEFDPQDINPNCVVFDLKKLDWLNGVYIRKLTDHQLKLKAQSFLPKDFPLDKLDDILPLIKERLVTLAEIEPLTQFFYRDINIDQKLLIQKSTPDVVKDQLEITYTKLKNTTKWTDQNLEQVIRALQETHAWQKRQYFMMLRIALTGQTATPPLFATMAVMDKTLVLKRLKMLY